MSLEYHINVTIFFHKVVTLASFKSPVGKSLLLILKGKLHCKPSHQSLNNHPPPHPPQDSYARERDSHKKAKLAYVGTNAKPPRNVRAAQAKNGTAGSVVGMNAKRPGAAVSPTPPKKPKVAPMMAKTLKMARGIKGFRR